jgi:hypothetical protein
MTKSKSKANAAQGTLVMLPSSAEQKPKPQRAAQPIGMYCRCLADPEGSPPCRVPDDFMVPSVANKSVEEFTVTTDANGAFYGSISTSLVRGVYSSTTIGTGVAGVVDGTAYRNAADYATLTTSFLQGRLVTYQVTIQYIGPVNTCAGRICVLTESEPGAYGAGAKLTDMFDDGDVYPAAEGGFVRVRPRQPPRMEPLTGVAFGSPTFDSVFYCGVGLPANSTCITVRVTKHLELVPQKSNIWRGVAGLEPYNPWVVTQAVNMAHAGTTGSAKQRGAMTQLGLAAAAGAWNYLKEDVKYLAAEGGAYAAGAAKTALLALM